MTHHEKPPRVYESDVSYLALDVGSLRPLGLVLACWALVALVVGWALAMAWSVEHFWPLAVLLGAIAIVSLSVGMFIAAREALS